MQTKRQLRDALFTEEMLRQVYQDRTAWLTDELAKRNKLIAEQEEVIADLKSISFDRHETTRAEPDLTYLRQWAVEKSLTYFGNMKDAILDAKLLVEYVRGVESEKEPPTNGDIDNGD